jgi:hypothetical protein
VGGKSFQSGEDFKTGREREMNQYCRDCAFCRITGYDKKHQDLDGVTMWFECELQDSAVDLTDTCESFKERK